MIMQQIASAKDSDDEDKGKENNPKKDPMRFIYKTKVPHEKIVINLTPDQNKMIFAVKNQSNKEYYFQGIFSIEDLPDAFQYFDTILHLYQDMRPKIEKKQANIQSVSLSEDIQILKIRMKMYKQVLLLDLRLQKKYASQVVKQSRNLKMLQKEQKQQAQKLKDAQTRQRQLDSQLVRQKQQVALIKKQQMTLLQNSNKQFKQQIQQQKKERTMIQQVMIKKQQVMELYFKLLQAGHQFSQKELELRKKLIGVQSDRKGKKRIFEQSQSQSSSQSKLAKGFQPIKAKGKFSSHLNRQPLPKQQTINEIIVIYSDTDNPNEVIEDIQRVDSKKNNIAHAEQEQPNASIRRLQLDENESNKQLNQAQQQVIRQIFLPEEQMAQQAEKNVVLQDKNVGSQLPKQEDISKPKRQQGIVVLQSEQSKINEQSEKQFGKQVKLDFRGSQNISKFQCKYSSGRLYIQRSVGDKVLYHIYHKQPIKDFQNMQFTILGIQKRDLTFGIMKKQSLKSTRLSWLPNSTICWVGCSDIIFPARKIVAQLRQSDHITVSVNTITKNIKFKVNNHIAFDGIVPDDMLKQCYFFIETATKGNKIYCKN